MPSYVMTKTYNCRLCNAPANAESTSFPRQLVRCPICGDYEAVEHDFLLVDRTDKEKSLLSALIRKHNDDLHRPYLWEDRPSDGKLPRNLPPPSVAQKIEAAVVLLADRSEYFGAPVTVWANDWPRIAATGPEELNTILDAVVAREWVVEMEPPDESPTGLPPERAGKSVSVSASGWEAYDTIRPGGPGGNAAFIAMWFDDKMSSARSAIRRALTDCEYEPVVVDEVHHLGKICERIEWEIRRSAILVADFTGNRGGVYYEAGLARGLGIPVVWTCKECDVADLHFDTRQYNHIVWKDEAHLHAALTDRIKALYPLARP